MISPAECARLADRAYREATYQPGGDVEALLVETPGYLALAGRGSEFDFQDWLRNFRAYPWHDWQLGMVHKGYLEAARSLWPLVSPRLLDPADPRPRVLTGHSAGASIVTVIAGLLCAAGRPPALLCTFGCPRVGFRKLGAMLASGKVCQWRYVHGNDCVPDHPWPVWGYRHPCDPLRRRDEHTTDARAPDHYMPHYLRITGADAPGSVEPSAVLA